MAEEDVKVDVYGVCSGDGCRCSEGVCINTDKDQTDKTNYNTKTNPVN